MGCNENRFYRFGITIRLDTPTGEGRTARDPPAAAAAVVSTTKTRSNRGSPIPAAVAHDDVVRGGVATRPAVAAQ